MSNNATGDRVFYLSGQAIDEDDGDLAFEVALQAAGQRWRLGAFLADLRSCFDLQPEAGRRVDRRLLRSMLGRALRTCKYHCVAGVSAYLVTLAAASDVVRDHWS